MTPAHILLADLARRGFRLRPLDGRLGVSPSTGLTEADRVALRACKDEVLALLADGGGHAPAAAHPAVASPPVQTAGPVFIDLETRSRADLKQAGGRRYALDPSTSI
jgi:hypothetical protein